MTTRVCIDPKKHGNCAGRETKTLCNRCKHGIDPSHLKAAQKTQRYNDRMRARAMS